MKKILTVLVATFVSISCMGTTTFASEHSTDDKKPYICYFVSDEGAYKVSEEQLAEIIENKNFREVIERAGLAPINVTRRIGNAEIEIEKPLIRRTRTTGHWYINSDTIKAGYRVTYSDAGNSFRVDSGEELYFSIEPSESVSVTIGATGSNNFEITEYVDLAIYGGIAIGTDKVGSYKCYVQNKNSYDFDINGGDISVR